MYLNKADAKRSNLSPFPASATLSADHHPTTPLTSSYLTTLSPANRHHQPTLSFPLPTSITTLPIPTAPTMADRGGAGAPPSRGGVGFGARGDRGGDRGRGGRGGRGRGGRRGGGKTEEKEWQPVTKLGRLVKAGKIKSMEEIYLHSLPIKEYQIVDFFLPKLKDEVMKVRAKPPFPTSPLATYLRLWMVDCTG